VEDRRKTNPKPASASHFSLRKMRKIAGAVTSNESFGMNRSAFATGEIP
jgi:hypothetical protein